MLSLTGMILQSGSDEPIHVATNPVSALCHRLAQAMQQCIESPPAARVILSQSGARLSRKTAGRIRLSCGRQRFEARQQKIGQRGRRRLSADRCVSTGGIETHHSPPSLMPRCCLASALIICGIQGGS